MERVRSEAHSVPPRWLSVGFVIQCIASIFGFAVMMFLAVTAVKNGRGIGTYRTVWLTEESWISLLVFVGCGVAALLLGAAFRFREHCQWREFEKKFEDQSKRG
jgi:phosphotransferase system  glucose/maltose/N-acetylglucosamine-specific IIC component